MHRAPLPQSSTDALLKFRGFSTLERKEDTSNLRGTTTQSPSMLQSSPKSAFTSIESKKTMSPMEEGTLPSSNVEKDQALFLSGNNNVVKPVPNSSMSNEVLLSGPFASSIPTWCNLPTPGKATFQPKTSQTVPIPSPSTTPTSTRTVGETTNLQDRSPLVDTQYGRSLPRFVYTPGGNVPIERSSFPGHGLAYHQIPTGSFISPLFALSYPGLHIQDKAMSLWVRMP